MNAIARTGFIVSVASYVFFLFADFFRPGFVSSVFSVHLFLIPIIVFGIWFALVEEESEVSKRPSVQMFIARIVLGLMLAIIFWKEGGVFGDFRLVLALVVFSIPLIIPTSINHSRN